MRNRPIRADAPKTPFAIRCQAEIRIVEAEAGKAATRPTFSIRAYNGGLMRVPGWYYPVAIDLAGLTTKQRIAALINHDPSKFVGQSNKVEIGARSIDITGVITDESEDTQRLLTNAKNGAVFEASVGVQPAEDRVTFIDKGETAKCNGRTVKGPCYVVGAGTLREVSFVPVGADGTTEAKIAASAAELNVMTFEEWLKANGFEPKNDAQRAKLQAAYDAEQTAEDEKLADKSKKGKKKSVEAGADPEPITAATDDMIKAGREAYAAESIRIGGIKKVCAGKHAEIEAKAIADGWTFDKTRAEVLEAELKSLGNGRDGGAPNAIIHSSAPVAREVLECAIRLGSSEQESVVAKQYKPEILEAASKRRGMGFKALVEACCAMEGKARPSLSADVREWVKAGFSTVAMPGILNDSMNKMLLTSFQANLGMARRLFKKLSANDFKKHTGYRLGGESVFKKVGDGGELEYGNLKESSFEFQIDTFGRIIAWTRQQYHNDSLGAMTEIVPRMGLGAAKAIERLCWTLVLANTGTFFGTGNKNYIEGATTILSQAGLDQAKQKFVEQVDDEGEPIGVNPQFLVVPPALDGEANRIFRSDLIIVTGLAATNAKSVAPAGNNYKGQFEPITVPHLGTAMAIANASDTAWYLWGDPLFSPFGLAYLNGQENPVVEEVPLPADCLGMAWRGYIDFGACQIEKVGAVKSKGAA